MTAGTRQVRQVQSMDQVAVILADHSRQLRALARPRLAHSSMEGGTIPVFQPGTGGLPGALIGQQYDGTYGVVPVGGPVPPVPEAPTLETVQAGVRVGCTGDFVQTPADADAGRPTVAPLDFARFEVEVAESLDFTVAARPGPSISNAAGGNVFVPWTAGTALYARLRTRSAAGKVSAWSAATGPVTSGLVGLADLAFDPADYAGGMSIFYGSVDPVDPFEGDLWLKQVGNRLSDGAPMYRTYRYTAGAWQLQESQAATQALADAAAANQAAVQAGTDALAAQATANAKMAVYRQASAPTGLTAGDANDLWIDTDDGKLYAWTGSVWVLSDDQRIATALTTAGAAQTTANSKTTIFVQISAPSTTGRTVGDVWIDSDDGNKIYDWPSGGGWTARPLGAAAISATARQLGAINIYRQTTQPASGMLAGDYWLDSDDGNKPYYYTGSAWVLSQDTAINTAITAAATAQATADGKMRIFVQISAPTGLVAGDVGDMWIDTDDSNVAYTWSGTAWVKRQLGNGAIQPQSLIASNVIATGTVTAALLEALLVLASTIVAGDPNGTHARMTTDGFAVYALDPADGSLYPVVRMGTSDDDYFAIAGADGLLKASIDSTGKFQGRTAVFTEWPQVSAPDWTGVGGPLDTVLDRRPRGLVSWGGQYTNASSSSNSTAGVGVYEISGRMHPLRMYKLHTSPLRISGSVVGDLCEVQVRGTSAAAGTAVPVPTITSDVLARSHVHVGRTEANSTQITKLLGPPSVATGSLDVRMLLCYSRAAGTGNVLMNAGLPDVLEMWLEDIGPWLPNQQGANSGGGGTVAPAPAERIVQVNSTWVESYKGDGLPRGGAYAWQGYGDSFNGMQRSFIGFPDLTATLAGSSITEIAVLLYSEYWWWNSGGQAVIGQHGYAAPPGSLGPNRTENMTQVPMARGEKRWVQLPLTNSSFWLTGQYRGVMLGSAGMGTNNLYYGRFNSAATLSIKYVK